jgi:hypothetical protein
MNIDLSALGPLASAIETAGAPILAAALRAAAPIAGAAVPIPFAGPIVTLLINQLADAVGGAADVPAITAKIQADPGATEKLRVVQENHLPEIDALLKVQESLDLAEMNITASGPLDALMKFYFAGWRPFAGWTFGAALSGTLIATAAGWTPPANFMHFFDGTATIFLLLIGTRTTDKIFGVATNSLKSVASSVASKFSRK